jgi:PAS domain S-box-containing protein
VELRRTLAAIPYSLVTADLEGNLTYVSPRLLEQLGYCSEDSLLGKNVMQLVAQEDRMRAQRHLQVARQGDFERGMTFTLLRRDGTHCVVDLAVGVVRDAAGHATGTVAVARESSELDWAQRVTRAQSDLVLALNQVHAPPAALETCLRVALEWAEVGAGAAYLVDPRSGAAELCCGMGLSDRFLAAARHCRPEEPIAKLVRHGRPHYAQYSDPGINGDSALADEGLRSWAVYPVQHEGHCVAGLVLFSRLPRIPDRGRRAVEALAAVIGSTLERIKAEEQLQRSQRLEVLGQLAGGIAHDFNNVLTAITGTADLILGSLVTGEPLRRDVEQIHAIAERGTHLTGQLLAFSRGQSRRAQGHPAQRRSCPVAGNAVAHLGCRRRAGFPSRPFLVAGQSRPVPAGSGARQPMHQRA